jgi:hypothetical protein
MKLLIAQKKIIKSCDEEIKDCRTRVSLYRDLDCKNIEKISVKFRRGINTFMILHSLPAFLIRNIGVLVSEAGC